MLEKNDDAPLANKRILFIGHDASLTGAPILLLNLLKLLQNDPAFQFDICLQRGGPLLKEYQNIQNVFLVRFPKQSFLFSIFYKLIDAIYSKWRMAILKNRLSNYDLIFSNTIANGRLLDKIRNGVVPVVTYVHELETVMDYYQKSGDTQSTLSCTDLFLYPSTAVSINLQKHYGIAADRLLPLAYFFPSFCKATLDEKAIQRAAFCKQWNIDPKKLLIVGSGTVTYRKGTDRFVNLVAKLRSSNPDIHFVWIGDFVDADLKNKIDQQIREEHISTHITFTGPLQPDPALFLPFDLFLLPSREDPYPLVVLEAASNGIPSVCFKNNGGIASFVNDDAGWSLEDLSDDDLSDVLLSITNVPDLIRTKGLAAQQKFYQTHGAAAYIKEQFNAIFAKA